MRFLALINWLSLNAACVQSFTVRVQSVFELLSANDWLTLADIEVWDWLSTAYDSTYLASSCDAHAASDTVSRSADWSRTERLNKPLLSFHTVPTKSALREATGVRTNPVQHLGHSGIAGLHCCYIEHPGSFSG